MASKDDFDMDDLINLINNTKPTNHTNTNPNPPPKKQQNAPSIPSSNTFSDDDDDDDNIDYLLASFNAMNTNTNNKQTPPTATNGTNPSMDTAPTIPPNSMKKEEKEDNPSHATTTINTNDTKEDTSSPFKQPSNASTNTSLDDLMSILSPSKIPKEEESKQAVIKTEEEASKPAIPETPKTSINISIRTLTGMNMTFEMEPDDTVKMIKLKIYKEHKIWPQHQRLVYGGESLTDKHTLKMLGIRDNSILYLVLHTICSNTEPPKTISIQKLNGDIFEISCTSKDSVQTLKRTIQNQEGYDIESQILVFHNNRLENIQTLQQYNIQNNSMLFMMVKNIRFDIEEEEDEEDEDEEQEEVKLQPFTPQIDPNKANTSNANQQQPILPEPKPKQPTAPPPPPMISEPSTPNIPKSQPNVPKSHPLEPIKGDNKTDTKVAETKKDIAGAPDLPPALPPSQPNDVNGWKVGDICYRNGEKCIIKSIDFHTNPASLTVTLFNDETREINTEFNLISKIPPKQPPFVSAPSIPSTPSKPDAIPTKQPSQLPSKINAVPLTPLKPNVVPSKPLIPSIPKEPPSKQPPTSPIKPALKPTSTDPKRPNNTSSNKASPNKPSSSTSPTLHNNNGKIMKHKKPIKPKRIHLCSPSIIRQLMAVNNIKYVGGGLKNLGNSCFMNATLQCLSYTQVFQNYICQKIHSRICTAKSRKEICFMCELHELLPQIINHGGYVCTARNLFNYLSYLSSSLVAGRQEDSHEFWTALVKHLQSAVIKPHEIANNNKKLPISIQETSIIYKIWGGYLRSQILCTICRRASNTYDSIIDLSLEIRGCNSIQSALRKFTIQEKLENDNKYFCQFCNKKQNAIKQLSIFDAPNILILHLKRFEFGTKIDKFIQFDSKLDLTPFMSKYDKYKEKGIAITYTLYAVLIHSGKYSNCGHYYSYTRTANNKWYLCNDSSISSSTKHNVLKQNGYMFFYQRNQRKVYHTY